MTHCKRFENLLALHVEDDLESEESSAVERHLADCPDCRDRFEALAVSQALFRSGRVEVDTDEIARRVRRRVLDRIDENPEAILGWRIRTERAILAGMRRPVAVATACGVAVLIVSRFVPTPVPETADSPEAVAEVREVPETVPTDEPVAASIEEVDPGDDESVAVERDDMVATPAREPMPVAIDREPLPAELNIPPQRTVKLVTDNPQVIIYWVLEEGNEGGGA